MTIGVLSLQGAFAEHIDALRRMNVNAMSVRLPRELEGLNGLIIPGGESTTVSKLMQTYDLIHPLRQMVRRGFPVWGTCAGMVLLGQDYSDPYLETLGVMDITTRRNAFGRQRDSFEVNIPVPVLGKDNFHAVFIRAPIVDSKGPQVDILATLSDSTPVAVKQGKLLACAFHPELTEDLRFHRYFLSEVVG